MKINDRRIPEHPRYYACSDGQIIGPQSWNHHEVGRAAQFWDPDADDGRGAMNVIMLAHDESLGKDVPQRFDLAEMVARGFGAPKGYRPGFRDGDPSNCKLTNLIMPGQVREPAAAGARGRGRGRGRKGAASS